MNPAANAATSGGIAGAAVVIVTWLAALAHVTVPADVGTALAVLGTAAAGYVLHTCTKGP